MKRNPNFSLLRPSYLFPEINARKQHFLQKNPGVSLISLGIGDTTEPLTASAQEGLLQACADLGTRATYSGYGPEQGMKALREKIATTFYAQRIRPEEVFISDGAKCDLGRLQMLFGSAVSIAVQDPAYPVYIEGSLIQGVQQIIDMPCLPQNGFFPDLNALARTDLIYFCSPNNPTGAVATRAQLEQLVEFAKRNRSLIIFDAAYANYIQDASLPKSIFEIEGAKEVAIEVNSFSKLAGFTGVRLGWTVIPEALTYEDGSSVRADWNRLTTTIFNGASNIAQTGGFTLLTKGLEEITALTQLYLENARLIKEKLEELGFPVYGGVNAPYLWVYFEKKSSWEMFQYCLEELHLITTPGSGFGPAGEGFLRFSAFGERANILRAIERLSKLSRFSPTSSCFSSGP
jgi:LL-diaminopimelate aminotransferase